MKKGYSQKKIFKWSQITTSLTTTATTKKLKYHFFTINLLQIKDYGYYSVLKRM